MSPKRPSWLPFSPLIMFSMLLMLLLLVRVGLLVGLLVVTGEEEGAGSSDFMLLAGLLANLERGRVESKISKSGVG